MPYVHPIPVSERHTLLGDGSISEALAQFSKSGYIHKEPEWRHLGKWNNTPIFIDLGSIKKSSSEEDIKAWTAKTLKDLWATAGPRPLSNTPDAASSAEPLPSHPIGQSQNPLKRRAASAIGKCKRKEGMISLCV